MSGIDAMLDREQLTADARRVACPHCGATDRCTDRFGHPTSMVHPSRIAAARLDPAADAYPLQEGPT